MVPKAIVTKKTVIKVKPKSDRPTAKDKELEEGMAEALKKVNFFGPKPIKNEMPEIGRRAIRDKKSEEILKRTNALLAAKLKGKK